jgi:hypothetical protein
MSSFSVIVTACNNAAVLPDALCATSDNVGRLKG